jgi:Lrp/AsnC family transcriptional regulator for asnA, asnC and gidA
MGRLDELDMKILSTLHADSSLGVSEISRRLGSNPSVTYTRIRRMRRRGVIEKFTVEVNEDSLGRGATAIAGLEIDPKQRRSVLSGVGKVEGVRLIREVTGRFDVLVDLKGRTLDELHKAVYEEIGRLPGVLHAEVFMEVARTTPAFSFKLECAPRAASGARRGVAARRPQLVAT